MTKRIGRPGMPPSPNQQKVLDALREFSRPMSQRLGDKYLGVCVNTMTEYLAVRRIGGATFDVRLKTERQLPDGYLPWHRSTVRDHLNDLVLKEHVRVTRKDQNYYLPVEP